jgi:hypothetical protein
MRALYHRGFPRNAQALESALDVEAPVLAENRVVGVIADIVRDA